MFAKRTSMPEHLARHRLADLFVDTLPCNAHTTASDALWAGLPVLTQIGGTFPGRVAASLLNAIGLPELVTSTMQAYKELAISLAANPAQLALIKRKLVDNRLTTPLFDTKRYTRNIEAAYTAMYERYRAGLSPDHIIVRRQLYHGQRCSATELQPRGRTAIAERSHDHAGLAGLAIAPRADTSDGASVGCSLIAT